METIDITPAMFVQYDASAGAVVEPAPESADLPHLPLAEFI